MATFSTVMPCFMSVSHLKLNRFDEVSVTHHLFCPFSRLPFLQLSLAVCVGQVQEANGVLGRQVDLVRVEEGQEGPVHRVRELVYLDGILRPLFPVLLQAGNSNRRTDRLFAFAPFSHLKHGPEVLASLDDCQELHFPCRPILLGI